MPTPKGIRFEPSLCLVEATISQDSFVITSGNSVFLPPDLVTFIRNTFHIFSKSNFKFLWNIKSRIVSVEVTTSHHLLDVSISYPSIKFSLRDAEILTRLVLGQTNPQIATDLFLRPRSVANHVARLLTRLDLETRGALAATAQGKGWVLFPLEDHLFALWKKISCSEPTVHEHLKHQHSQPGVTLSPLRIGIIVPEHSHTDAKDMLEGSSLAIEQWNARGGINGRFIEQCTIEANVFDQTSLSESITRSTKENHCDALIFGYCLDYPNIGDALEKISSLDVPTFHASTSGLAISYVADSAGRLKNVFHLCGSEEFYGYGFLQFTEHHSVQLKPLMDRTIAVIDPPPGMTVWQPDNLNHLEDAGWAIIRISRNRPICSASERKNIVDHIGRADPGIIFAPTFFDEELLLDILRWKARHTEPTLVYSLYTPSLAGFLERSKGISEGLVWSTLTGRYNDPIGQKFADRFKEKFHRSPGFSQASVHYDAVNLLGESWLRATHPRDLNAVLNSLRDTVHRGVNGTYLLDSAGQHPLTYGIDSFDPSISQVNLVYQIFRGKNEVIYPSYLSSIRFELI